ncbi:hypothetical protein Ais01nite_11130 [Asanoa ishikariensis]|uniref:Imm1 family immunity protein n=1 Tax=Asanoa ishikariensis TaxID=137265 RepID=UPI0015A1373F|nr:Imm1 family immunity protein [Asanoa ishikariensis]GIF63078.1 hypothetical protein Ais01nite_11130 [Asanoa ishikariensis]
MRLELDRWADGRASSLNRTDPTADEIEAAVRALDQRRHTELVLTGHDGQYLAVEGGAGHYLVHLGSDEHDDIIALRTPAAERGEVEVVAAGRVRRVDRRSVVDLDTALRAVRAFAIDGRPDSTLYWGSG